MYIYYPSNASVYTRQVAGGQITEQFIGVLPDQIIILSSSVFPAAATGFKANSSISHTTFGTNTNTVADYVSANSYPFFVQAINIVGTAGQFSGDYISFVAFHTSLTAAESALFYSSIQALRQNLGGGYI